MTDNEKSWWARIPIGLMSSLLKSWAVNRLAAGYFQNDHGFPYLLALEIRRFWGGFKTA